MPESVLAGLPEKKASKLRQAPRPTRRFRQREIPEHHGRPTELSGISAECGGSSRGIVPDARGGYSGIASQYTSPQSEPGIWLGRACGDALAKVLRRTSSSP